MASCFDCEGYEDARKGVDLCPLHDAAPALLEALERVLREHGYVLSPENERWDCECLPCTQARAAIAQAKSER